MLWKSLGAPAAPRGPLVRLPARVGGPFGLGAACPERFRLNPSCLFSMPSRREHSGLRLWRGGRSHRHPAAPCEGPRRVPGFRDCSPFLGFPALLPRRLLLWPARLATVLFSAAAPPLVVLKSGLTVFPARSASSSADQAGRPAASVSLLCFGSFCFRRVHVNERSSCSLLERLPPPPPGARRWCTSCCHKPLIPAAERDRSLFRGSVGRPADEAPRLHTWLLGQARAAAPGAAMGNRGGAPRVGTS